MVCLRNFSALLLALAAAPSIMASPAAEHDLALVGRANGGGLGGLLGGDDNSSAGSSSPSDSSPSPASASATPTDSPSASPTDKSSPSDTPTPSPTNSPSQSASSPSPTSAGPTSKASPTSIESVPPTTAAPTTSFAPETMTPSPIVSTDSAGKLSTFLVIHTVTTSADGHVATVAVAAPTGTTQTDTGNKSSSSSNPSAGKIVGIVVGTVGGVILIAALAAVGWRVWGKKRHSGDEDDVLMGDGVYGTSEIKSTSAGSTAPSPFQNNLEQYHTPGRANPSANF